MLQLCYANLPVLSCYCILSSLLIFRGYLLVTHILSCYNALDKIVNFWEKKNKRAYIPFTISHTPLVTEMFNELKDVKPGIKFPSCSTSTCLFCCVFVFQAQSSHHQLPCLSASAWTLLMQQVRDIHTTEWHLNCFEEKQLAVLQL